MSRAGRFLQATVVAAGALSAIGVSAPPAGAAIAVHEVLDFSRPAAGPGWSKLNVSRSQAPSKQLDQPRAVSIGGTVHLFGLGSGGGLFDESPTGPSGTWVISNLSVLSGGPPLSGAVSVASLSATSVEITGIGASGTSAGHLVGYATVGASWQATDLSLATGAGAVTSTPSDVVDAQSLLRIYTTTPTGDLVQVTHRADSSWGANDLTVNAGLPTFASGVTAAMCPTPAGPVVCIFGISTSGALVEVARDGTPASPWSQHDVSAALGAGTFSGPPAVLDASAGVLIFAVRTDGTAIMLSSPSSSFTSGAGATRSTLVAPTVAPFDPTAEPTATAVGAGLAVALRSSNGDLVVFRSSSASSTPSGTDVTAMTGIGGTLSGAPTIALAGATLHVAGAHQGQLSQLGIGQSLTTGQSLLDPSVGYRAILTIDGNFGVYTPSGIPLWSSGTASTPVSRATMLADGSLGLFEANGTLVERLGSGAGALVMQGDGRLVLVNLAGVVWASVSTFAEQVVLTGLSQLNLEESPPGSNCNPFTAYFGRGWSVGCAPGTRAEEWCSDFAEWVWLRNGAKVGGITGWSYTFIDYGLAHGTLKLGPTNNPQPGDAIVWGDISQSYGQHVGIVAAVSGHLIDMVSGNWGDKVDVSGWIDPSTYKIGPYGVIGYVGATVFGPAAVRAPVLATAPTPAR